MRNCRSWLYQRTVSTVSTKCLPPFYINSENIYWEPSMCQALLSHWDTSVKKTQQGPCGAYIFHGQEMYPMCLYSHKDSWSFHKERYWRKCSLNWTCGQRLYLQFCLSVCLSLLCLSVSLFSVMKTVCSIELSRWSTNSSSFLILKDFLGSLWIPLKHYLTPFLKIPVVHFVLLN